VATVHVDTSGLTFPLFTIPGQTPSFIDGSTSPPPAVSLAPGSYSFQQASGYFCDFQFEVTAAGTIEYETTFDAFLGGRGGSTLVVGGFDVRLDGTALSHGLFPVIAGAGAFLMPDSVHDLKLVPASHYSLQPTSGVVATFEFAVDLSGKVRVAPLYSGFASGSGTTTLTISGYTINVDGRSLSHDLFPVIPRLSNDFLPRSGVSQLTLIPAAGYGLQPGSGIVADMLFSVGIDGLVDFPVSCDGFLGGRGSDTLIVNGYPVLVDASAADSDLLSIANVGLRADAPRYLFAVLVPAGGYQPQTAKGVFAHGFGVERDGTISVDPSTAGSYVVTTVPRLEIHGATPF
jgi:hypothetical protein